MFDTVCPLSKTSACLVTKQFFIVFDRQTFPVWTGLKVRELSALICIQVFLALS